jgi:DNA-binding response OmpR family regulator
MVDDDTKLCDLIKDYLEPMGFDVTFAHNGNAGLARALSGDYQAVLLDMMMPGMDGIEVLQRIRSVSKIPVLMLTGRGKRRIASLVSKSAPMITCRRRSPYGKCWPDCVLY